MKNIMIALILAVVCAVAVHMLLMAPSAKFKVEIRYEHDGDVGPMGSEPPRYAPESVKGHPAKSSATAVHSK